MECPRKNWAVSIRDKACANAIHHMNAGWVLVAKKLHQREDVITFLLDWATH